MASLGDGKKVELSSAPNSPRSCIEQNQVVPSTVTTILVRESEGTNVVTTTMATTRGATSVHAGPSSMWKRSSGRSSAECSRPPHLHMSTSRPAAIRIEMVEPVGPSAYSLSLQAQRSPLEQWKLLKNKLIRKKSTEEDPVLDPAERFRQTVRAAAQEEGIICRTNELKRLLQKGEVRNSGSSAVEHSSQPSSSSNRGESHSPSLEVTEVTNPSSPSSTRKENSSESSRKNSFKSLSPSSSSPSVPNHEVDSTTTVKWDEVSNTLDSVKSEIVLPKISLLSFPLPRVMIMLRKINHHFIFPSLPHPSFSIGKHFGCLCSRRRYRSLFKGSFGTQFNTQPC